ncbi:dihydroxyacetone kinase subunit DhaL [Streptomyces sp. NPDC053431]|uniref:dihydroxyacetone kinase subunit DhaL n=1 Tax=Streptomyces sp. NPDC053431 TaxID=3365703 RepID=UPI0037D15D92
MRRTAERVQREAARLDTLDGAIGDGDHGNNVRRGFTYVAGCLSFPTGERPDPGRLLSRTGDVLINTVGGASGPLLGGAFRAMGHELTAAGGRPEGLAAALDAGAAAIQRLGAARPGDKTMYDAFVAAAASCGSAVGSGAELPEVARAVARAAQEGMRATVPMQARKGRASYLGLRSVGHQDPGATTIFLIFDALKEAVEPA